MTSALARLPNAPIARSVARTRVLHLIDSGGLYGAERMLLALLPALSRQGASVALGCFGPSGTICGLVGDAASTLGITTFHLGFVSRISARGTWALARLVYRWQPTLMHFHGYKATIVGGAVSVALGTPAIATCHGSAKNATALSLHLALDTFMSRRLRSVVAVSEQIAEELVERGIPSNRVRFIPNGIDDRPIARRARGETFTLAVIGRLIPEKNVQLVLEALASLRHEWPQLRVLIAGDGPYQGALTEVAVKLGIAELVSFLGFVEDVPALLARSDAFVMASQAEGMPISLLEAMAAGVPVVATSVGSIPWVTREGRDALLIPRDDLPALKSAIQQLLQHPEAAAQRAIDARGRFDEAFSCETMAMRYLAHYQEILCG